MDYESYTLYIKKSKNNIIKDFLDFCEDINKITFEDVNDFIAGLSYEIQDNLETTYKEQYSDTINIENEIESILYDTLDIITDENEI